MTRRREAAVLEQGAGMRIAGSSSHRDPRSAAAAMAVAVAVLLILVLMAATYHRNQAWQTLLSLWADCAAKSPQKSRTHNNLGNCYMLLGMPFQAIPEYERAIALDPNNIEAYYNLASNLDAAGFAGASVRYYTIFCERAPRTYESARTQACRRLQELTAAPAPKAGP